MTFQFTPEDPAFVEDPYPVYKALRDEYPTYLDERTGYYVITRHEDVGRILGDFRTFSSSRGNVIVDTPLRVGKTLGTLDPPRHDDLRRIVIRGVTPARIEAMIPAIKQDVASILSDIGARRECDFMASVSRPVLYGALGRMLGLDDQAATRAAKVAGGVFHAGQGPMGPTQAPEMTVEVFDILRGQLERRQTERGDDLFSMLLDARDNGSDMTDGEILGNMSTVLLAGSASVGHYFSNFLHALWVNPDERAKLLADPTKLDGAIEEGIRWDTSTQAFARHTTVEVEVAGTVIPADRRLVVFYAAANRDERAIAEPDRFDIDRRKTRHFGFGSGPHICLGAQTARAMLTTILGALLPALGEYELDLANAERVRHVMARGFYRLPIRW